MRRLLGCPALDVPYIRTRLKARCLAPVFSGTLPNDSSERCMQPIEVTRIRLLIRAANSIVRPQETPQRSNRAQTYRGDQKIQSANLKGFGSTTSSPDPHQTTKSSHHARIICAPPWLKAARAVSADEDVTYQPASHPALRINTEQKLLSFWSWLKSPEGSCALFGQIKAALLR
jgi:hypothetical protein